MASRNHEIVEEDSIFVTLRFADGSNGSIAYLAEGDRTLAKERIEIYGSNSTFVLDDFRRATLYRRGREQQISLRNQDKGQKIQAQRVCDTVRAGGTQSAPITHDELAATTRATFCIREALRTGEAVNL